MMPDVDGPESATAIESADVNFNYAAQGFLEATTKGARKVPSPHTMVFLSVAIVLVMGSGIAHIRGWFPGYTIPFGIVGVILGFTALALLWDDIKSANETKEGQDA